MKTVISFGLFPRQLLWRMRTRLSRILALIAWRFLLKSQRYIMLRDLVLETPDGPTQLGLVVVSTRGIFVVETWDANIGVDKGCASGFERGSDAASCYRNPMHYSEECARLVASVLEEDRRCVSPVAVCTGPCVLPEERPSNVVSEFGLVQYIRSFKVDVYTSREIQEIASRLVRPPSPLPRLAA